MIANMLTVVSQFWPHLVVGTVMLTGAYIEASAPSSKEN